MAVDQSLRKRLADLLEERLKVIGNHDFRDRDAEAHLAELKRVSEELSQLQTQHAADWPPRLKHFLEQRSYDKALAFISED